MADIRAELEQVPGEDPGDAHRPDGRRPRHRPRQAQGAPRRRRGHAAVPQGLLRVLRRPGQDARRAWPPARSARPPPAGWTATSTSSRPPAAAWSCSPRATARRAVTDACKAHGGFYLGSIGGPAARLAQDCITKVEVLEYPELGMEAVWKIEVAGLPRVHRRRRQGQRLLRPRQQAVHRHPRQDQLRQRRCQAHGRPSVGSVGSAGGRPPRRPDRRRRRWRSPGPPSSPHGSSVTLPAAASPAVAPSRIVSDVSPPATRAAALHGSSVTIRRLPTTAGGRLTDRQ